MAKNSDDHIRLKDKMQINLKSYLITSLFILLFSGAMAQTGLHEESFKHINLDYPGLEKVKTAFNNRKYEDAGKALLTYYRKKLAGKPDLSNLEIPVDTNGALAIKTQEIADKALLHQFKTQEAYGYFDFGKDIDWQLWPIKDNEVRWQLHRVKWWLPMALAYRGTKDEKYAKEWILQLEGWIKKNPLGLSADNDNFAWRPLEVSDRIQSLVPIISIFITSSNVTPEFLINFLNSYHQQANYLLSNYADQGNHRLFEAQRTLFAGASFPEFKNASKWRKSGITILNTEIVKQVYPDGLQYELSPVYHAGAIDIFVNAFKGAQKANLDSEFPPSYKQTIEKMVMAFINITFPNYNQPMFGDSWWKEKEFRLRQFQSWSAMFPDNPFINYFASEGKTGQKPNWLSRGLTTAGFYTFRNGWETGSTILMLKASPPGEFHAQPDNGTFELWVKGRNFTPDAGCFVYSGNDEIMKKRNWFRQTTVHSTLTLDNQNMVITQAALQKWETSKTLDVLTYTNPSYKDLNHCRSVLFIDQKYFLIVDQAIGRAAGNIGIHYQLKEDSQPRFDQGNRLVTTNYPDGNNLLIQCLSPKINLKQEEGKVSYEYGKELSRPAFAFEAPKSSNETSIFLTIVYPYSDSRAPKINVIENNGNNYQTGQINLTISVNGEKRNISVMLKNKAR
ncbi:heparinase II/III family protein [Pedobacter sp. MC2016-05]|uniref:heparin-sulfate lyase HepC n=1 Tax=Pedobacter sp. MC2016-05 TaxID=2994474 RepID=UPI002247EB9A|nr:heparin-sulfate lyase HepC [Pedobacter sp. MC2016-05]MCX2477015.1 heparinase II/III family protein [Pedobacter sp. MC2016-05]